MEIRKHPGADRPLSSCRTPAGVPPPDAKAGARKMRQNRRRGISAEAPTKPEAQIRPLRNSSRKQIQTQEQSGNFATRTPRNVSPPGVAPMSETRHDPPRPRRRQRARMDGRAGGREGLLGLSWGEPPCEAASTEREIGSNRLSVGVGRRSGRRPKSDRPARVCSGLHRQP